MHRPEIWVALPKSVRILLASAPAIALVAVASLAVFSAQRTPSRVSKFVDTEGQLGFSLEALQPASGTPRFEPVALAASYTSGAFLDGHLYLAGPGGLTIADRAGASRRTLRTGIELPVDRIVSVASGRLRGSSAPQILLATAGAGVLLLQPEERGGPAIVQLLPTQHALRDLTALLPLASGDLLIGTRHNGVLVYSGTTLKPLIFTLDGVNSSSFPVTALAAADAASFLIGTANEGVLFAHAGTVQQVSPTAGLPDAKVESIVVSDGHAYVGTPLGTAEFSLWDQTFHPARILGAGLFSHSLSVQDGELLIGTLDQGFQAVPLEQHAGSRRASIVIHSPPNPIRQRIDGFIHGAASLYALADGALIFHDNGSWRAALNNVDNRLADPNISALAFAPDGSLYVGFFDHGLDIVSPDRTSIRHLEDDHLFCINRLALDPRRHTLAAATANGLVLFNEQGQPTQTLTRRDGLISDHVTDIAFLAGGTALATPAGITFLTPAGAESLYAFQGLVSNHVYALAAGPRDQLLAGTLGGLSILRAGSVQRNLTVTNSELKHNWITAALPDGDGGYFVGTYGAGLESLDAQGNISRVELPTGSPHDLVINPNALFATETHLYAGTLGHGFLVYNKAAGRWSAVTQGMPSLNVTSFAAKDGELYIGTENGLVRIPEAELP